MSGYVRVVLLGAMMYLFSETTAIVDVTASIETDRVIHVTDKRFLSVVMGPTVIRSNWGKFNFSHPRVRTLASALAPAIFRIGGNQADLLVFNRSATTPSPMPETDAFYDFYDYESETYEHGPLSLLTKFYMTAKQWDDLNAFTRGVGWNLLFDLNVLLRHDGEWDSSNALQLIQYSIEQNYTDNLSFELGNEPNLFPHYINRTVDPAQLGKDFMQLHYIMRQNPAYRAHFTHSLLVGPDTTRPSRPDHPVLQYVETFLRIAGQSLSAITWHQYYMNGPDATPADFTDPLILDQFPQEVSRMKAAIQSVGLEAKPLMLGETGTCWGGAAPGLSDRYANGFLWLDKLGIAAQTGHSIVMRQTFYEGHSGLLNTDLEPTPDYWLSLMFKTLVGTEVFDTSVTDMSGRTRVYAQCTATDRTSYPRGSLTVYALNVRIVAVNLTFSSSLSSQTKHIYWFTPQTDFHSEIVLVNGQEMKMPTDTSLPTVKPLIVTAPGVNLPATTFGFIVFPNAGVAACMS